MYLRCLQGNFFIAMKENLLRNKSVLLITDNLRYGGAETYTVYLANELLLRGYKVCVLANDGPLKKLLNKKIKYFKADLENGIRGVVHTAWKIFTISRQENVAIVHTQKLESTQAAWIAKFFTGIPVIKTAHGYTRTEIPKLYGKIDRYSDKIITVADFIRRRLYRQGLSTGKIMNLFNGVNVGIDQQPSGSKKIQILKRKLGIKTGDRVVVTVARIVPKKGFEELVSWFPFVLAKVPNAKLLIVGDGEAGFEVREELLRRCKSAGLDKFIKFSHGTNKINELLKIADVYCAPRVARGMSVLEAMAAGLPVVGARPIGEPQVVVDGKTGFVVPKGDNKNLAEKLAILLNDKKLSKRFGLESRKRAKKLYSLQTMTDKIEKIYMQTVRYASF